MQVREDALAARFLVVQVLQDTHGWLEEYEGAGHDQTDDDVLLSFDRVAEVEVVQVVGQPDPETHGTGHHNERKNLYGDVDREDFLPEVCVLQAGYLVDREVDRDSAKRVEDDEDYRHDACVPVSQSVEDDKGVIEVAFLMDVSGVFEDLAAENC